MKSTKTNQMFRFIGILLFSIFVQNSAFAAPPPPSPSPMQLEAVTTSNGQVVSLPLYGNVNCIVNWGDSQIDTVVVTGFKNHTYSTAGTYTISISGTLSHYGSDLNPNPDRITKVITWGQIGLNDLRFAFNHNSNLISVPDSIPVAVTNTSFMFSYASAFNDTNIAYWNTSNVQYMEEMFSYATSFNVNIGNWDVSNVTNMHAMFYNAWAFNQPISNWDVSSVETMMSMFQSATSFNQPIGNWDVSNVTNMSGMFNYNTVFNQAIGNWNVSNVTNMSYMFSGASSFNQNLNNWNVSKVKYMNYLFSGTSMNQPLNNWNVSNVENIAGIFANNTSFNQSINSWNVSKVTNMHGAFYFAQAFNQPLNNWNTSSVTDMSSLFQSASAFNQSINSWNVGNVTTMNSMFSACGMNQPLNNWNVSNVLNMGGMFAHNYSFNQPIGSWNVSNVTNMNSMFYIAYMFNQDLTNWCVQQFATKPEGFETLTGWGSSAWPVSSMPNWGVVCGCNMPSSLNASPTINSVTISWIKSNAANLSQIQVREKGTLTWGGTSVAGTSYTFNYLKSATVYEYRLRSLCTGALSPFSSVGEFTTLTDNQLSCQAPTGISANVNSNTSVTINWTAANNGTLYFVQFKPSASTWAQAGGSSTANSSRTFNYLTPGTTYDYRIRTTCTPGSTINSVSPFSSVGQFTTTGSLPGAAQFFGNEGTEISVYPNPTTDIVTIDFVSETEEPLILFVVDVTGRRVQTIETQALLGSNQVQISLGSLANGLYIIKSVKGDEVKTLGKVTKQ